MPVASSLLPVGQYGLTAEDVSRFADEAALGITSPSDPVLFSVAVPISKELVSAPETQRLILRLIETAEGQRGSKHASKQKGRGMVGLAAPQIGVSKRVIIVDTQVGGNRKTFGRLECFIDPEIIWRSRETVLGREGCFSAGPVWGIVRRPVALKIRAMRPDGVLIECIFEGFTARIVQHEIDHLNGIRFPDRIKRDVMRHWVHAEELPAYIKSPATWPRICSHERWLAYSGQARVAEGSGKDTTRSTAPNSTALSVTIAIAAEKPL